MGKQVKELATERGPKPATARDWRTIRCVRDMSPAEVTRALDSFVGKPRGRPTLDPAQATLFDLAPYDPVTPKRRRRKR